MPELAYGDTILTESTVPSEHVEQREFVSWFRKNYPQHRIFAIPNGEKRGKMAAARLKLEGVSKGVPDLFIPSLRLWVEMKRQKGGRLSPEQKEWAEYLQACGYAWVVAQGCDDARQKVLTHIGA